MNHKTHNEDRISSGGVGLKKLTSVFFLTIVLLITAAVSFAAEQTVTINLATAASKTITVLPNTDTLIIRNADSWCFELPRSGGWGLKDHIKNEFLSQAKDKFSTNDFEAYWSTLERNAFNITGEVLPVEGESKSISFECYTKTQLKTYWEQVMEFYGRGKSSKK